MKAKRIRLDALVAARGLTESRSQAAALILAGRVRVGDVAPTYPTKAGDLVPEDAVVSLVVPPRFVSRGGEKLDHALTAFALDVAGVVAADLGASTGGFTDCLLQHGAARVYAVDVGYGQLDYRLRVDPRVVVMDRTNARHLESLPEAVDAVVMDCSFISLALILPAAVRVAKTDAALVALVKPQFEAGKAAVGRGGVVRDPETHRAVLQSVVRAAAEAGLRLHGLVASPLRGPAGNVEFLGHWRRGAATDADSVKAMIAWALHEASGATDGPTT